MGKGDAQAWVEQGREALRLAFDDTRSSPRERPELLWQAVSAFDAAIALRPDDAQLWLEKAEVLRHLGRDAEAVAACDEVLRLEPGRPGALYRKAETLSRLGLYADALEAWDAILVREGAPSPDILPADLPFLARLHRGGALAGLGRSADAHKAFVEAFATRRLGWESQSVDAVLGRFAEARSAFLESSPDPAPAWKAIGRALAEAHQHKDAIVAFETAILFQPDDAEAWSGKGDALVCCDRQDEAKEAYREYARLFNAKPAGSR